MYKIRSAITNPTLIIPHAGKNGTIIKAKAKCIHLQWKICLKFAIKLGKILRYLDPFEIIKIKNK